MLNDCLKYYYSLFLCSSTSDECSPLHQSQHQTNEHPLPQDDARQEQTFTQSGGPATHAKDAYSLRGNADGSGTTIPFATSGPCYSRPVQASPNSDTRRSNRLQIVPDQPAVRRYRLSSCLPSCLQPEDWSWICSKLPSKHHPSLSRCFLFLLVQQVTFRL